MSGGSFLPQFRATRLILAESLLEQFGEVETGFPSGFTHWKAKPGSSMRRTLRKSIPFVWALLIGTLAGALVAGVALFAAHS
jgi:hypothetical protein